MSLLDRFLHSIPMYRLVSTSLVSLAILAIAFSGLGVLQFDTTALILSLIVLTVVAALINQLLALLFKAAFNLESWLISALILFFILPPTSDPQKLLWLAIAATLAMASKYLLTINHHPIFNPAAFAAVVIGLLGLVQASWWVATPSLLIPVIIIGCLITHKLHRWQLVSTFIALASLIVIGLAIQDGLNFSQAVHLAFASWPIVFLATIMLTEPTTLPNGRYHQLVYAATAALLMTSRWSLGPIHASPELALVLANLAFFTLQPKQQATLTFKQKIQLAPDVYEFVFTLSHHLNFQAGQYLSLTLPKPVFDQRGGNRRTFTIASAPQDDHIRFATRISQPASKFKTFLNQLQPGQSISAATVAGQFILPTTLTNPVVLIAGGIGITPYISMIRHLLVSQPDQLKHIHLIYQVRNKAETAYQDLLEQAQQAGLTLTILSSDQGQFLTEQTVSSLQSPTPALWYISGPPTMVDKYQKLLQQAKLPDQHIKTDYFSGY